MNESRVYDKQYRMASLFYRPYNAFDMELYLLSDSFK